MARNTRCVGNLVTKVLPFVSQSEQEKDLALRMVVTLLERACKDIRELLFGENPMSLSRAHESLREEYGETAWDEAWDAAPESYLPHERLEWVERWLKQDKVLRENEGLKQSLDEVEALLKSQYPREQMAKLRTRATSWEEMALVDEIAETQLESRDALQRVRFRLREALHLPQNVEID